MDAANEPRCGWDVPRPALRLCLTLALGALGALLSPPAYNYPPFPGMTGPAFVLWLAAAFAAALLLRRADRIGIPWLMLALTAAALVLSALYPRRSGGNDVEEALRTGWLCLMFLLLFAAGAAGSQLRSQRGAGRPWRDYFLRGPAVAVTAPLLLFASRPVPAKPVPRAQALSKAAFGLFPHILAAGFAVALHDFRLKYADQVGFVWRSFSVWTWFGCAVLFLLNPWPEYPRYLRLEESHSTRLVSRVGAVCAIMAMLLGFAVWRDYAGLHRAFLSFIGAIQYLVSPLLLVAFFLIVGPWPAHEHIPKMGELPAARAAGPLSTAVFMAIVLVLLGPFVWRFIPHVTAPDVRLLFVLTFFGLMVFAWVAAARWMSNRRSRAGYWAFTLPAIALCLCLVTLLTVPYWWLIQRVRDMGFTIRRLLGLAYALGGYLVVPGFLYWALQPPERENESQGRKEGPA